MNKLCSRLLDNNNFAFFAVMVLATLPVFVSFMMPQNTAEVTKGYPYLVSFMSGLTWLAGTITMLVTLRHGPLRGALLLPLLFVPGLVAAIYTHNIAVFLYSAVCKFGVTWLLAWLLFATNSWSMVIETGCLIGVVAVMLIHWWIPDTAQFWLDNWQLSLLSDSTLSAEKQQMAQAMAQVATGLFALMSFLDSLSMIFAARWIQARLFNQGGLKKEILQIRCSFAALCFILAMGVAIAYGYTWAIDATIITIVPIIISTFILVHAWAQTLKYPWLFLVPMYLGLVFAAKYVGWFLAIIFLTDLILRYRSNGIVRQDNTAV